MFNLHTLLTQAKAKGLTSESKMWQSIAIISAHIDDLQESHPDMYWCLMRKLHGLLYDRHYTEAFANYDVNQLQYTDREGIKHTGPHWSLEQVVQATKDHKFPSGVNDYDKYVAYNSSYADLCQVFDEPAILQAANRFWFHDEDWSPSGSSTKIWDYTASKP